MTRGREATGFTLLELIVVLAIVGIVLAVAVPSLASAFRTDPSERALAEVTGALAEARAAAVRSGVSARAALAEHGRVVAIPTRRVALEPGVTVEAAAGEEAIEFHPTGLASGARWRILVPGAEPIDLVVSPIDGAVGREP